MMFYTYIIRSLKDGSLYKGHTQDLAIRLNEHNSGKTKSIKSKTPFELIYSEAFHTREQAVAREKYFKSAAGRRWIQKNVLSGV